MSMGFPIIFVIIIFVLASLVVGAATIITTIVGALESKEQKQRRHQIAILNELVERAQTDHSAELQSVIASYKKELLVETDALQKSAPAVTRVSSPIVPTIPKHHTAPLFDWNNWYSENSISLLLYIGAVLIILTASILLAFSWQSISGVGKAMLLTLTTLGFLGAGIAFLKNKSVHHAGSTFTAIGTILITFTGIGWYSFVLKDMGVAFGWVGITSSLLTIVVSMVMSFFIAGKFYPYITSIGMIASMLSLIQISGPPLEWYVFTTQIMSFVFLGMRKAYGGRSERDLSYQEAAEHIGQLLMPISVVIGVWLATQHGVLWEMKPAIMVLLASVYYFISYTVFRLPHELSAAQALLPLGTGMMVYASGQPLEISLLLAACLYFVWSTYSAVRKGVETSLVGLFGTTIIAILGSVWLTPGSYIPPLLTFLSGVSMVYTFILTNQDVVLLPLAFASGVLTLQLIHIVAGPVPPERVYLSLSILSFLWYIGPRMMTGRTVQQKQISIVVSSFFFAAAFAFIKDSHTERVLLAASGALMSAVSVLFEERWGRSLFTGMVVWLAWDCLQLFEVGLGTYVEVFAVIGYMIFGLSRLAKETRSSWENHAFTILLLFPYILPVLLGISYVTDPTVWINLVAAGLATSVIASVAFIEGRKELLYKISVSGMMVCSWLFVRQDIQQFYAHGLLWGIYLLVLSVLKRNDKSYADADALDWLGIFAIFVPGLYEAFTRSSTAAVVVGGTSLVLIAYGISRTRRLLSVAGSVALVAAILSQTYTYILGLEQWMVTGILGCVFLIGAITLLIKRNNKNV